MGTNLTSVRSDKQATTLLARRSEPEGFLWAGIRVSMLPDKESPMNFDHLTDRLGDRLRSLPAPIQTFVGWTFLTGAAIIFVYALLTPDPICVGCP